MRIESRQRLGPVALGYEVGEAIGLASAGGAGADAAGAASDAAGAAGGAVSSVFSQAAVKSSAATVRIRTLRITSSLSLDASPELTVVQTALTIL